MSQSMSYVDVRFAILDEQAYYRDIFRNLSVELDPDLMEINGPFIMDSQFEALNKEQRRNRKRKKGSYVQEEFSKICSAVSNMAKTIRNIGRDLGYFQATSIKDNNKASREAARRVMKDGTSMYNAEAINSNQIEDLVAEKNFNVSEQLCMLSSWYRNSSDLSIVLNVSDRGDTQSTHYYIPARSMFHIGNVTEVDQFALINGITFDLIVMDPPWYNLSVKRKGRYVMNDSILKQITIDSLSPRGLVAIWITNRKGIAEEVAIHLKRWNLKRLVVWHWLKVTKEGEPVCEFHLSHKVPFESLILAVREECAPEYCKKLPSDGFIFSSIPMAIHSRKPPLQPIFDHFGISTKMCLELFARSLFPRTLSVGFEPLLLQASSCFVQSSEEIQM